jgi:hypothetical protein
MKSPNKRIRCTIQPNMSHHAHQTIPQTEIITHKPLTKRDVKWHSTKDQHHRNVFLSHDSVQWRKAMLEGKIPGHLSSQNWMWTPLLSLNRPKLRNESLTFMRPLQNWESPGFFCTWVIVCDLRYFRLSMVCHSPSSLINLNSHLFNKHIFYISIFWTHNPPWSFGWHMMFHLASLYFFLCW